MVARSFFFVLLLSAAAAFARNDEPDPRAALENFVKWQQFSGNAVVSIKYLTRLEKAVGRSSIYSVVKTGKQGPVLVLVYFSRAHHKPWMQGYLEVNEDLLAFVRRGSFSKHLYQFGDLRPDQARQSVWEMAWEGRVVRVEITPNNAITAAYYSMGDYMTAMDANRASLPFPSKGW